MRLVYLGIGWATGIIAAAQFPALIPLFWLILLALSFALTVNLWRTGWRWWLLALMAFSLAGNRYQFVANTSDLAQYNALGAATVEGVIHSEPDRRDDRLQVRVAVEWLQAGDLQTQTSGVLLLNAPREAQLNYGDRIRATGSLNTPGIYDTFSYADYLARQNVFSIMDDASVEVLDSNLGNSFFAALLDLKANLQTIINLHLPDPQAALLTGILLGNERGIDPALNEAFTRVGASHIIAISGFNMTLIAGIIIGILERIFRERRWLAIVIGILVLALYTLLVGANAAVVRAAIMSSLLVIGGLLKRNAYVPASLAFVAIVMSAWNPLILWDLSFQLSFFAVLGLALFTEPLTRYFDRLLRSFLAPDTARTTGAFLSEPVVVSLAALSLTLPIIVVNFQRLSLVSLIVNLLIVPAQPTLLILGGLAVILGLIAPAIAQFLFWLDWLLLSWSIGVVRVFAALPFAETTVTISSHIVTGLYILIIGGSIVNATRPSWARRIGYWVRQRPVFNTITASSIGIILLVITLFANRPDGRLHIWWLDVGHSHAVFMSTPDGAQILIDGGRFPSRLTTSIGDRMPFNDRHIELLVITQPDEFDTGALSAVVNRYSIGTVITNGQPDLSEGYQSLLADLSAVPTVTARAGHTVEFSDGVMIEVLHPQRTPALGDALGDGAIVLRVSYGDVSFLITSDVSVGGQQEMLDTEIWPLATVMSIPQHGTARSLDELFIEAVQPQAIVLQSDPTNRRGDPNPDVLAMLPENVPLLRTDQQGTIHLSTDGRTLWAQTEN